MIDQTGMNDRSHRGTGIVRWVAGSDPSTIRTRDALEAIFFGAVAITTLAIAASGLELTFPQWRVLVIVGEDPDGASVTEIAVRLGAMISPVSRLVTRLARSGLVSTEKDPRDRRVTRVFVTDRGRSIRETVLARRREEISNVLAAAGPIDPAGEDTLERIGRALRRYT
jgi:DNA-binding MarR family transcriptional regulator